MTKTTITIELDAEIIGTYSRGTPPTHDHPGDPEDVEVESVRVGGIDITDALTEEQIEACRSELFDAAVAADEGAAEDAADAARELARERQVA